VDVLKDGGQPLTIPEILQRRNDLALSSAYRNLTVLERAGVVTRVVTTDEFGRYELAEDLTGHHHHLICSTCGMVRDVELPDDVEEAIERALAALGTATSFVIDEHRLDLVGRCEDCR
jgi:Fur family transcriptional regulator, ferric uptake regulator